MSHRKNWEWFGNTGHFICGQWCRFHLCTKVGPWLVSTVGEYVPEEGTREILAQSRGIKLEGHEYDPAAGWMYGTKRSPLTAEHLLTLAAKKGKR